MSDKLKLSYSESPFDGFIQECESSGIHPTLENWERWWRHSVEMAADTYLNNFKPKP